MVTAVGQQDAPDPSFPLSLYPFFVLSTVNRSTYEADTRIRAVCQCLSVSWVETHCGGSVVPAGCLFEQVEPWGTNEPRENYYIMTDTSLPYICQHRQAHKVNTALNLSFCPADQFYSARVVVFGFNWNVLIHSQGLNAQLSTVMFNMIKLFLSSEMM